MRLPHRGLRLSFLPLLFVSNTGGGGTTTSPTLYFCAQAWNPKPLFHRSHPVGNVHHRSAALAMSDSPGKSMWDEKYSEEEFVYGTEPNGFLKETLSSLRLSPGKCLMLADGEGRNGVYMAEQGFDVVSVDYSSAGMEKAKQLAKSRNVEVSAVVADLGEYDLGNEQWDCVVGIFCHFPPPVRAKVLAGIPPSLKNGGYFILECYTPEQIKYGTGGPPSPEPTYTKKMLSDAFSDHLVVERNEELERDVIEGKLHTGKAAVVQFIGKKAAL